MVASTLRESSGARRQSAAPLEASAERLGSGDSASVAQSSGDEGAVIRSAMVKPGIDPNVPQAISLTGGGVAYTQNFDTLSNTAGSTTNNLLITDWFLTEMGSIREAPIPATPIATAPPAAPIGRSEVFKPAL
jgi:hypothetical protein